MNMQKLFFVVVIWSCYLLISIDGKRPSECELPKVVGRCRALIPSYYFNSLSGKCEYFSYGGCEGNANRFSSEEECLKRCENNKH